MRPQPTLALAAWLGALVSTGCASIPRGRAAIDRFDVVGARALDPRAVRDRLATSESPRFLGLFEGFAGDYSIYDPSILQRDLARVERYYRGHGFFEAHALVGRIEPTNPSHVRVEIVVTEGPAVVNGRVRVDGLDAAPPSIAGAVRRAARSALPLGARFDEDVYQGAQRSILQALTDRGYAYASVRAAARVDLASHTIDYVVTASPGIPAVYGPLRFVGLDPDGAGPEPQEIDESILRRVMNVKEGAAYSTTELEAATQSLLDLEVFSAVHVVPGLADPSSHVVPLVVQLEPTKLRALRVGGGAEFDEIKTELHALTGWENHNLLGNLRDFTIDFKPGVVLYPTNVSDLKSPTDLMLQEQLRMELRQPGFIEARTTGFARAEFNVYPLLVETNPSSSDDVVGYVEPKGGLGLERRFGPHLFVRLAYNVQGEIPIRYKNGLDPTLPTVVLSFPQLLAKFDIVDNQIHPHRGFAANADVQVAGGPFGGTASDVRIQPDVEGYIPVARGVTFALTAALGLLFPFNYGTYVEQLGGGSVPGSAAEKSADNRDIETVYFRGFFSGGPSGNRGYPLRGVAPHGFVPFLNPATARAQVANSCNPSKIQAGAAIPDICLSPVGGFTMWEASAELRFDVSGPFGVAAFCDASDVSQAVGIQHLRFNYLHMSCGAGARYDTPVGPIRLDLAYRIPPLQKLGSPDEYAAFRSDPTFGVPTRLFTLPMAIAFGIGEAF